MRPSRAARHPCSMIPRSAWAAPRRGAAPRTVTSSEASTIARSASIIGRHPARLRRCVRNLRAQGPASAGLSGGRLLHETQPVLDLFLLFVHVEEPQVLLDGRPDALLEGVALDAQVLDHPLDLAGLAGRLVEELPTPDLRLFDDELRLLPRLFLDVLGQLLGRDQGILQDPLALLVVGEAGLDLRQLLLERVVFDDQLLELARHQVQERSDFFRVEAPHPLREAVAADIDRGDFHVALLSPKRARPTRTIVAPSSIATSKSSVMPMDRCVISSAACRPCASCKSPRSRRKYGRLFSGSGS